MLKFPTYNEWKEEPYYEYCGIATDILPEK